MCVIIPLSLHHLVFEVYFFIICSIIIFAFLLIIMFIFKIKVLINLFISFFLHTHKIITLNGILAFDTHIKITVNILPFIILIKSYDFYKFIMGLVKTMLLDQL